MLANFNLSGIKNLLFIGPALLLSVASPAQNFMGFATSPYGGTNRLYLNPALAADSPHQLDINVVSANAHADNNYVRYRAPYSLLNLLAGNVPVNYRGAGGQLLFETDYTAEVLDGRPKSGTVWGEVRGPAIQWKVGQNKRSTLGFSTRLRASAQVQGASQDLLSAIRSSLNSKALYSIPSQNNQLSANTNTYSELGFTYAGTLWDDGEGQKLLVGATLKYLVGYTSGHLINRGLSYQLTSDPDEPSDVSLLVDKIDADLGYTTYLQNRKLTPRTLLSSSAPGRGVGVDIGVTYVSQPDPDGPTLRIGAALTDLGGIRYKGEAYDVTQEGAQFSPADFNNIKGTESVADLLRQKFGLDPANSRSSFRSGLPTSLNLSGEYQLASGFGLALVWLQDMRSLKARAMHQPTLVSVTPRYERGLFALALPITYLNHSLMAGVSVKLGPIWLGSDNVLGLIGNRSNGINPKGVDVYAGLAFGIGKRSE